MGKEIEIRVRQGKYSHCLYWNVYLFPHEFKKSIYKKYSYDSYIRFEHIPENWLCVDYFLFFDKLKGWYYPKEDDIKIFSFKILICILYNCRFNICNSFDKKKYLFLYKVFGLGQFKINYICKRLGIKQNYNLNNLNELKFKQLIYYLNNKLKANIKFEINLGTYEGNRHRLGYPVRGQRSLSNGKSQKFLHKFRLSFKVNKFSPVYVKNFSKKNSLNQRKDKKKNIFFLWKIYQNIDIYNK